LSFHDALLWGFLGILYYFAAAGVRRREKIHFYPNTKSILVKKVFELGWIRCSMFPGFAVRCFLDLVFELGWIIHSCLYHPRGQVFICLKRAESKGFVPYISFRRLSPVSDYAQSGQGGVIP
jgi:hypothetical protein